MLVLCRDLSQVDVVHELLRVHFLRCCCGRTGLLMTAAAFTFRSYGRKARNVVDVYVPRGSPDAVGTDGKGGTPVALFCHGGVWAAGDKWQVIILAADGF